MCALKEVCITDVEHDFLLPVKESSLVSWLCAFHVSLNPVTLL